MSKESSYVVLCMDPVSSRIYFVSEDGRKSTQAQQEPRSACQLI